MGFENKDVLGNTIEAQAKETIEKIINQVKARNIGESEFHQTIEEVLHSLEPVLVKHPEYIKQNILGRIVEPDRQIMFRVPWVDDKGQVQVNTGYRVQFNSAIGPYKGGIRLHPSVNIGIIKFLGFEQIFKNSLTGLPIGGGKGGSDFDPKGKSDREIMAFCQSFMTELCKYIGADTDVPAGDIGTGAREIGYMFGQYKRIRGLYEGVLTGKGLTYGGSLARTEATGYGVAMMAREALAKVGIDIKGAKVALQGCGNVGSYAGMYIEEFGAKVVIVGDHTGTITNPDGIDMKALMAYIPTTPNRGIKGFPGAEATDQNVLTADVDLLMPCALENQLTAENANDVKAKVVCEGANGPTTPGADEIFTQKGITLVPDILANSGGVTVSYYEWVQNLQRDSWSFEEVQAKQEKAMKKAFDAIWAIKEEYGVDMRTAAYMSSIKRVADAMKRRGWY